MAHRKSNDSEASGGDLDYRSTVNLAFQHYYKSQKKSARNSAVEHGLPARTFQRWINNGYHAYDDIGEPGQTYLTPEEEDKFAKYLLDLSDRGFSISKNAASTILVPWISKNGLLKSTNTRGKLNEKWWKRFLKNQPDINLAVQRSLEFERSKAMNPKMINRFFNVLQHAEEKLGMTEWFNADESGSNDKARKKKTKVLKRKYKTAWSHKTSVRENITTVGIVSSALYALPPVLIYKAKNAARWMSKEAPAKAGILATETGMANSDCWLKIVQHMKDNLPSNGAKGGGKFGLIVDGHKSHVSHDVLQAFKEAGFVVISLPPHCTTLLQPLDISCFAVFKNKLADAEDGWHCGNLGKKMTQKHMGALIAKAWYPSVAGNIIQKGFRDAGISPFNPNLILESQDMLLSSIHHGEESEPRPFEKIPIDTILKLPSKNDVLESDDDSDAADDKLKFNPFSSSRILTDDSLLQLVWEKKEAMEAKATATEQRKADKAEHKRVTEEMKMEGLERKKYDKYVISREKWLQARYFSCT